MRKQSALTLVLALSYGFGSATPARSQQSFTENNRKVVKKVQPQYPLEAKRMGLGGTVKVVAVVAPDGNVKKVEPIGGSPLLVQAAEAAISQWKYAPGNESKVSVEVHFTP